VDRLAVPERAALAIAAEGDVQMNVCFGSIIAVYQKFQRLAPESSEIGQRRTFCWRAATAWLTEIKAYMPDFN